MFCENCGAEISDEEVFCPNCGAKVSGEEQQGYMQQAENGVESFITCQSCGTRNAAGCQFCASCGKPLYAQNTEGQTKKKKPIIGIIIGVVCAAALAAAVFFVINLFTGKSELKDKQLLYIKDETLYKATYRKLEPTELADDVVEEDTIGSSAYYNSNVISAKYSEDDKYLFYRKYRYSDDRYILYYLSLRDKDAEPEKIDSGNIYSYEVLPGNRVLYLKDDTLYVKDLKDNKEKISSDVYDYVVSEDGSKVLWGSTEDGKLYYSGTEEGAEKEKLDSEVTKVLFHSGDFSKIVYLKGSALYVLTDLSDSEKIASDVDTGSSIGVAEGDKGLQILYYEMAGTEEVTYGSFVIDDLKEQDEAITEPKIEDYQTTRTIYGYWGTRTETETSDEYYEKLDEYNEKLGRDKMREGLAKDTMEVHKRNLVLYDDTAKETVTVLEDNCVHSDINFCNADGVAVAFISYADVDDMYVYKFNLSDLTSGTMDLVDIHSAVDNASSNGKLKMVCGTEVYEPIDVENSIGDFRASDDGECLYAILFDEDREESELIQISLTGKDAGNYETLYDDAERIFLCKADKIYYGKDVNENDYTCDLYCNDDRISHDVSLSYSCVLTENDSLLYFKDRDSNGMGTLCLYDGSDSKKVSDDVATYYYLNDKKIVVMTDISRKSGKGDVRLYNGKETKKIDSNIQAIVIPSGNRNYEYYNIATGYYYEEPAVEEAAEEAAAEEVAEEEAAEEAEESSGW